METNNWGFVFTIAIIAVAMQVYYAGLEVRALKEELRDGVKIKIEVVKPEVEEMPHVI